MFRLLLFIPADDLLLHYAGKPFTPERRLAFTPPESADETDMSQIDIEAAANEINNKLLTN